MKRFIPLLLSLTAILPVGALSPGFTAPETCGFKTAALPDAAWECSEWISSPDAPVLEGRVGWDNARAADGASWFVAELKNGKEVKSAVWMTAGLGVYSLYVNGKPVGAEVLKPGYTHYAKTKRSFTYDITDAFLTGKGKKNTLSAQATPGWWGDKIITPEGHEGMIGERPAFRSVLELTYADGSKELFGTSPEGWKSATCGPVRHAAIFDGEEYDARLLPAHAGKQKLLTPVANTEFHGEILPSEGAEIYLRPDLAILPQTAYVWEGISGAGDDCFGAVCKTRTWTPGDDLTLKPGETLVVDFGQNCAAVPCFTFKGTEGTRLQCLPSEILNDGNGAKSRGMDGPEGSVHRLNLRLHNPCMRIDYTFGKAKGFAEYMPGCSFFGYRFLSVTADAPVTIRSIYSVPVTSIARDMETGTIITGNDMVNKLISNTMWGMRSNYLSVPTDCPQRDERLGWTADTQVFATTGTFFANTLPFFHKWTRDLRDTQSEKGGFPGTAPWGQYCSDEASMCRLGWADAGVIVPWTVWKQFGDTSIIEENWDAMERYINHIAANKYDHHRLAAENGDYQWADWLSYEPLESNSGRIYGKDAEGKTFILPEAYDYWNYLSACYWAVDAGMMRDMARATGRNDFIYEVMHNDARQYIASTFFTPEGLFKTDILNTMQTPDLFALWVGEGLFPGHEARLKRLRKNFEDHGNCLQTGFLGTSILMQVLTDNGMADIAYELLFQRKNPSWLYSIDNGATTIWERWNSYMIEHGMGPQGMNSFNHYAYGCVCQWLWETAAGIATDPAAPGFRRIIMKPRPDRRLGSLDAVYPSAAGTIESHWHYEGDDWVWSFTIPEGAKASVTLPGEKTSKEYRHGTHSVRVRI